MRGGVQLCTYREQWVSSLEDSDRTRLKESTSHSVLLPCIPSIPSISVGLEVASRGNEICMMRRCLAGCVFCFVLADVGRSGINVLHTESTHLRIRR